MKNKGKVTKSNGRISGVYIEKMAEVELTNRKLLEEIAHLSKANTYLHEHLADIQDKAVGTERALSEKSGLVAAMYRGFAQERDEKYAEIYRLENRMRALGFELPDQRKAGV